MPARSYFKLEEIDRKLRLLQPGHRVLDLGCWPGSWTLYAARAIGPTGRVLGIDLKQVTIQLPQNAKTQIQDAYEFSGKGMPELDVVLSDMAPKTMGEYRTDHARSAQLVELAMGIADAKLAVGGCILAKILDGAETRDILKQLRLRYETGRIMRPEATRVQSNEVYLVGLGKREFNVATPSKWVAPAPPPSEQRRPAPQNFEGW